MREKQKLKLFVSALTMSGSTVLPGWSHMEEMKNLQILNLTGCNCLERAPIFSAEFSRHVDGEENYLASPRKG
ncbi:hypothetical protein NL676_021423 [Syzygium grande]|nr:hypothetical protein NL676_021423 [Syzygium grande]